MDDLTGRTVLVLGGTGGVGEGVVRALLDRGARVVATSRDGERAAAFAARLAAPALHGAALDALAEDFGAGVTALAAAYGPFDAVVVSIASWGEQGRKPLLAHTDAEWDTLVAENQTAVFRAYRELFPHIRHGGLLLQLNGMSAEIPFPGAGGVALTAAATKSLTRTVAAETERSGVRVYEVILGVVRTRARQRAGIDDPRWIDGEQIGAHIADLLTGESPLVDTVVHYFVDRGRGAEAQVRL
jgi:NAD(P)-dependent dehydrogenase (short-subunit alcohol dehydrogenase family)